MVLMKRSHFIKSLIVYILAINSINHGIASLLTTSDSLNTLSVNEVNTEAVADDPLEEWNRSIFNFNQDFDQYILKPVTDIYTTIFPEVVREGIHNILNNLKAPVIFANDCFQLDGDKGMDTIARFLVNTTFGLGGIFDPANDWLDIPFHQEDFGETLGTYGFSGEPYTMLPILGPSNPRDIVGMIVDFFIDPFSSIARRNHAMYLNTLRWGLEGVDKRVEIDNVLNHIYHAKKPYAMMRSIYTQNRNYNIKNGVVDLESPTPIKH